jgi:predicted  nucleic acid-binding Zn-ribbon protein|tara:strand:- start:1990 stop:2238 length:249 start_codon:yes stop_codon:yes gene_type:complete
MTEEAVVFINDEEKKVSELSDEQRYLHSQLLDLRNKEASLKFQLDQVAASMSVFQNAFMEASKEVAEEVLEKEKPKKEKRGN